MTAATLWDVLEEQAVERAAEQRALVVVGRGQTAAEAEASLQERFEAFHAAHPEVYRELVVLARRARAAGRARIGIGMLWEVLRWERTLAGVEDGMWKLNNSFRSRYARLIGQREPDLVDVFETRELKA